MLNESINRLKRHKKGKSMLAENDRIEIQNLVETFIQQMNEWEKLCKRIEQDKTLSFEEQFQKQKSEVVKIFNNYCTDKERKNGRPTTISYGSEDSYEYDPETEKISAIEETESKNTAIVITDLTGALPSKYQYVVAKKKNKWLLDSKKRYSNWKKQWVIETL